MLEHLLAALQLIADPKIAMMAFAGVVFGLAFGILPGLSGLTAVAILLPFIYGMEPVAGLSFLLAAHASVYTGGSVSAILLGIPGAPANAATVTDGYALQQQGKGAYAVGAALTASALGGVLSAMALALLLPLLQPVVLAFGAPEVFLLALIGISYVAVLGQGEPIKGLISAGFGTFLALIGYQRISGVPRFWLGSEYLLDGIRLVPLVLGLFAIPEIVRLLANRQSSPVPAQTIGQFRHMWQGAQQVFKRPGLFLRSTLIGLLVGVVPGVGGETAPFLAYAAARKKFGSNREDDLIAGVIAPESSNNAKEGGALVPTLSLGIPGSAGMAMLMGGFMVLGLEPGPDFLDTHLDMAVSLAFILATTNLVAALLMVPLAAAVASLARLRGTLLAPPLLVLIVLGAYASGHSRLDVVAMFIFGLLGLAMKHRNYSRPALVLGFILGPIIETYLHISVQAYGTDLFTRPLTLVLLVLLVGGISSAFFKRDPDPDDRKTGS